MLTQMRNASKGWLATILVGLLILAFGTWGITGVFLPSPTDAVARVGDTKIEKQEFIREFTMTLDIQSQQTGQRISPQDAGRMGLHKIFLDQMITRTAFDVVAADLGLTAPESVLLDYIANNENFQGLTGEFDRQSYRELLYRMNYTEGEYEDSIRIEMARQQLVNTVAGGVSLPRGMVEALYKFDAEQRSARYLTLKPELAGAIPDPDEETLKEFHQAQATRYTAPELRSFTYLLLRPKDVLGQVEVPEEDVMREYETRKQQYVKPETRKVRQITYASRDEAMTALEKLRQGTPFEEVAGEKGLSAADADLGDVRKDQFLDPAVGEAAFKLETPGVTDIIEGQFGFVIAEVTAITPSSTQTLEEVRESLREGVGLESAAGRVEEIRADIEDVLAAGAGSLEEVAEKAGLKVVRVEGVDQTGRTADGTRAEGLPEEVDVLQAAFVNEEGEDLGFERLTGDGYFVVRIDEVKPSALRPLAEIRERVTADWRNDQLRQRLEKLAGELAARVGKGEDLAAIAAEFDLSVLTTTPPLRRNGAGTDLFSDQVLRDLFAAKPGEAVKGPVRNGQSWLVATLSEIIPPDLSSIETRAALNAQMERFDEDYGRALAEQYAIALRESLGVKHYESVLAQAIAEAR